MARKGLLVGLSAPSGGGKTTIIQKVLAAVGSEVKYSISATTRRRRANEVNGRDYFFLTQEQFQQKRENGEFVEWAEVHGNYYATPKAPIEQWLNEGKLILLDIDVDGGVAIKEYFQDDALLIFIMPPSLQSLRKRLRGRKTESDAEINKRLERYPKELKKSERYDYRIVNEDLEHTVNEIMQIIGRHYKKKNNGARVI